MDRSVREYMTRDVLYATPGESVASVLGRMNDRRVRHLLIVSNDLFKDPSYVTPVEDILGIVSNRDLLRELQNHPEEGIHLDRILVSNIMTAAPLRSVPPQAPLRKAAGLMRTYKLSALIVTDGSTLDGIVTSDDILDAVSRSAATTDARTG